MRTCGCGERGRHKPTCNLVTIVNPKIKREARTCGCGERGRHKKECTSRPPEILTPKNIEPKCTRTSLDTETLYYKAYGKPPQITWFRSKSRQTTVETRIKKLVKRYKAFYLSIADENEVWYIDGGNWAFRIHGNKKYNLIGHIKNIIPFLGGKHPIAWGDWNKVPEEVKQEVKSRRRSR